MTKDYIDKNLDIIKNSEVLLMQLEIPIDIIEHTIKKCKGFETKIILNPAPAIKLSDFIIKNVDYITPNQHEVRIILDNNKDSIEDILKKYPNKLIVTTGSEGAMFYDGEKIVKVKGYKVDVVDTTGAGDTFNGVLACCISDKISLEESIQTSNKAGAISVTKFGAQGNLPTKREIENLDIKS